MAAPNAAKSNVLFMGPSSQKFDTFSIQSNYYLDNFWPEWKNYNDPISYLVPPIFRFQLPDKSDNEFRICLDEYEKSVKEAKELGTELPDQDPLIKHRGSDIAEYMVFKAIEQLVKDKVSAPFIAIHNLGIEKIKYHLGSLFPDLQWNKLKEKLQQEFDNDPVWKILESKLFSSFPEFRPDVLEGILKEYIQNAHGQKIPDKLWKGIRSVLGEYFREIDFILIGPKIGVILIEVKHSYYTQKKHFASGNWRLPDDYHKGLKQLDWASKTFLEFLAECIGIPCEIDKSNVRKVIFTPNLRRGVFDEWMLTLSDEDRQRHKTDLENVVQWFHNDLSNSDEIEGKPELYGSFLKLFEDCSPMSEKVFETYAPLLVGLSSVIFLPKSQSVTLNAGNISYSQAIESEHNRLTTQDVSGKTHQAILLTSDQQLAIDGPSRQFIFGAAGTGKTIVIQEKARQLLRQNQSIIVFAPKCFVNRYREFFDNCGFTDRNVCRVCVWPDDEVLKKFHTFCAEINARCRKENLSHLPYNLVKNYVLDEIQHREEKFRRDFDWFIKYDHTFIDDAFDVDFEDGEYRRNLLACLIIMVVAQYYEKVQRRSLVWIASDCFERDQTETRSKYPDETDYSDHIRYARNFDKHYYWFSGDTAPSYVILRQVMRCSASIFQDAYGPRYGWQDDFQPQLQHRIPGQSEKILIREEFQYESEAPIVLVPKILQTLKERMKRGIASDNIAIIVTRNVIDLTDDGVRKFNNSFDFESRQVQVVKAGDGDWRLAALGNQYSLYRWDDVSSLQWPIVIFAVSKDLEDEHKHWLKEDYRRYRALSRATVEAIEITGLYRHYGEPPSSSSTTSSVSLPRNDRDNSDGGYDEFGSSSADYKPSTRPKWGAQSADQEEDKEHVSSIDRKCWHFGKMIAEKLNEVKDGQKRRKLEESILAQINAVLNEQEAVEGLTGKRAICP